MTGKPGQTSIAGQPVTGVDFAFDCIGLKVTMEQIVQPAGPAISASAKAVPRGARGRAKHMVELNAGEMLGAEKQFRGSIGGSCSPDRDFPMFLDWHAEGHLDLESLVTERYSIEQINEATTALEEGHIAGRAILEF